MLSYQQITLINTNDQLKPKVKPSLKTMIEITEILPWKKPKEYTLQIKVKRKTKQKKSI